MSSLKDKYDPDVIASIVSAQRAEQGEVTPENDPLNDIAEPVLVGGSDTTMFSDLFWKPRTIPDLPLRAFKPEDWPTEAQAHIPLVNEAWVWNRPVLERFALAMFCGDTTLLHGLQGTGKSCLAEQWCAKLNIPFWRMSCNRETREGHFLGSPGIEYNEDGNMVIKQEPTMLTDSIKYGGMFCEDEAFRHSAALVLQSLREKTNRTLILPDAPGRTADERRLVAPSDWWYVLTDNTCGSGDETGIFDAEVQDASTLDRIDASIEVNYLGKPQERTLMKKNCTLNPDIVNGMIDYAKMIRTAFGKQQMLATFSIRSLLAWAEKIELTKDIGFALQLTWYDKLCKDDQAVAKDMFHQVFARNL